MMSQAETIYRYFVEHPAGCADSALFLAWRRSQEPYRSAILDILLERGEAGTRFLIGAYHELAPSEREKMLGRVEKLYSGLRAAAEEPAAQSRLNALEIIRQRRFCRLADIAVMLLRDQVAQVAQFAGATLQELGRQFAGVLSPQGKPNAITTSAPQANEYQLLSAALKRAVEQFKIHRRPEAVQAAMYCVPPGQGDFWGHRLEPFDLVGRLVRDLLLRNMRPEMAGFALAALKHPHLRTTAARALGSLQAAGAVAECASIYSQLEDGELTRGLGLVRAPAWLAPTILPPEKFTAGQRLPLISFIVALGAPAQQRARYLGALAAGSDLPVVRRVLKVISAMERPAREEAVNLIIQSPVEEVALAGITELLRTKAQSLPRVMRQQLASPHPRVRQLAGRYECQLIFNQFVKNFDSMPAERRLWAGRRIFAVDPEAQARWRELARSPRAMLRLKAVRLARALGRVAESRAEILVLCRDADARVRSCAVAALGLTARAPADQGELAQALDDRDARVRANAIEAVVQRDERQFKQRITLMVNDEHNRVRANAVKALLAWRVESARDAIGAMLRDARPAHRRSGRWVVEELLKAERQCVLVGT